MLTGICHPGGAKRHRRSTLSKNKEISLINDIKNHLQCLLNTKQQSVAWLPNYGMPDLSGLLQSLPYTKQELLKQMKTTIERYEPRLSHIQIEDKQTHKEYALLEVSITAQLRSDKTICFTSCFDNNAYALLSCD